VNEDWKKGYNAESEKRQYADVYGTPDIYGAAGGKANSYRCSHCDKIIRTRDIEWRGTTAHCPKCGTELEVQGRSDGTRSSQG